MNVMPMFQNCRLNGVATIETTYINTYPHTSKHPAELRQYKKKVFVLIDKIHAQQEHLKLKVTVIYLFATLFSC